MPRVQKQKQTKPSPAAQKLIDDKGLDATDIKGTGKNGSITATDVNNYIVTQNNTLEVPKEIVNDQTTNRLETGKAQANLMLHCGANLVERVELEKYPVPETIGKRSVHIPHAELVDSTIHALTDEGYKITQHAHSITKEGARYFGLLAVSKPSFMATEGEFGTIVGMRNAYDGSSSLGFVMGMQLFVCDNLAFHGDVTFSTRHDANIHNLDLLIVAAAKRLEGVHANMVKRADIYKARELPNKEADHLMIEMLRRGVYNPSRIERVRQEWDNPSHDEFKDQNVWRLHNAVTEALKATSEAEQGTLPRIAQQTNRLHRVFDGYCERIAA